MSGDKKVVISHQGEILRLLEGCDYVQLTDGTDDTFDTDSIDSFADYLSIKDNDFRLFYDESVCRAIESNVKYNTKSIAVCSLQFSLLMQKLVNVANQNLGLDALEEFLTIMKPFIDQSGIDLLSCCNDFQSSKITSVKRKRDQKKGNFCFSISQEDTGKNDFDPPESVKFELPIFDFIDDASKFEFEIHFSHRATEDDCRVYFKFYNPMFNNLLRMEQKRIIESKLERIDAPKFWGSLEINNRTDEWKYKFNKPVH